MDVPIRVKKISLSAVLTKKDGTVIDLGVLSESDGEDLDEATQERLAQLIAAERDEDGDRP